VTALSDKSNRETRFELFERLNAGGISLSPQEVRAAIFRGPFNDMLRELAYSEPFKSLVKLQRGKEDDGTREEQVLKFFAYHEARAEFDGRVTEFLNNYMELNANAKPNELAAKRELFAKVVARISAICGGGPFTRPGYGPTPLVELEGVLVGAAEVITSGGTITDPPSDWTSDEKLVSASKGGTNTRAALEARIERAKELLTH